MIRGAVPGEKGGWVMLSDAVKRSLPENAPKPGAFRKAGGDDAKSATDAKADDAAPEQNDAPEQQPAQAEGGSES